MIALSAWITHSEAGHTNRTSGMLFHTVHNLHHSDTAQSLSAHRLSQSAGYTARGGRTREQTTSERVLVRGTNQKKARECVKQFWPAPSTEVAVHHHVHAPTALPPRKQPILFEWAQRQVAAHGSFNPVARNIAPRGPGTDSGLEASWTG